jgi:hypothetical protein
VTWALRKAFLMSANGNAAWQSLGLEYHIVTQKQKLRSASIMLTMVYIPLDFFLLSGYNSFGGTTAATFRKHM